MFATRLTVSIFSFGLLVSSVWATPNAKKVNLPQAEHPMLQHAPLLGPINPQQEITFTVWLKFRNKKQFNKLVEDIYDPQSARYQRFLTKEEYELNYAPEPKAYEAVENYFISQGMKTKRVHTMIQVTAKASQIEQTFQIKINNYLYKNQRVYGNVSKPRISSDIARYISGISNLSNVRDGQPKMRRASPTQRSEVQKNQPVEPLNLVWDSFVPQALPTTASLQGFTGQQIRTAYNVTAVPSINGQAIDGTGQTIVIIDGCGTGTPEDIMNDANVYNSENGLPPLTAANFSVVNYAGETYVRGMMLCTFASSWDGEIALDVEATHTMAPGAKLVLVMTDSVDNPQVATALTTITSNQFTIGGFSNAYVVSNSWDNARDRQIELLDPTLQMASTMGLSVNFAAGDCGDQTYNSSWTCSVLGSSPSIQYPVSSAYVTAVSGTSLFVDSSYQYAFESGWGNYINGQPYSGSMGGISEWRVFPSWQAPISNLIAGGYGVVGNTNRAIPDIAMDADYYTGLKIYQGGTFFKTGGASQSTPLFSGVIALVNQARTLINNGVANPIGQVAPYLYTFNNQLLTTKALNLVTPPHQIISGATPVNNAPAGTTPPNSAFNIPVSGDIVTFNWDGVLSIIENQFWNDVVGVGSPNVPSFVGVMARL